MAWIRVIGPDEAEGSVREAYTAVGGTDAHNVVRAMSLHPEAMRAYRTFSRAVTFGGSCLGRVREELIAVVVSAELACTY